jgi:hypothetical protein
MPLQTYAVQEWSNSGQGLLVTRAASNLPQTATTTFFNVTGEVEILDLVITVETAIQAQANAIKWRHTPTGGSVGDVSGTYDTNAAAAGTKITAHGPTDAGAVTQSMTASASTGGLGKTLGPGRSIRLQTGALGLNAAASNTGTVSVRLRYRPLSSGAYVAAA